MCLLSQPCYATGGGSSISSNAVLKFIKNIKIIEIKKPRFGHVTTNANTAYVLNATTGVVTVASGTGQAIASSGAGKGRYLIFGSNSTQIDIKITNFSTADNEVTLSTPMCDYNFTGGGGIACEGSGISNQPAASGFFGKPLYVGFTANVSNVGGSGGAIATPSFTIEVDYS